MNLITQYGVRLSVLGLVLYYRMWILLMCAIYPLSLSSASPTPLVGPCRALASRWDAGQLTVQQRGTTVELKPLTLYGLQHTREVLQALVSLRDGTFEVVGLVLWSASSPLPCW